MKRSLAITLAAMLFAPDALAQMGGMPGGAGGRPGGGGPTQSSPTRNKTVGPQRGGRGDPGGDDDQGPSAAARPSGEPTIKTPDDPLAVPEAIQNRIGTDHDGDPPAPEGKLQRSWLPLYEETKGDYRFRLLPPLYLEHTRGLDPSTGRATPSYDRQSVVPPLLFYQRRSAKDDADILFPLAWRVRDDQTHAYVLGPIVHREAPFEHDNWLAPAFFQGRRKDGGYFHSPLLLTTTRWGEKSAFTLVGPYFRDRTGSDVDFGIAPLFFHGDNGDIDGARKTYSLIPPLLYYNRNRELDENSLTVIGPTISISTPKRSIFDVAPLFFHIDGRPATGGVRETHTTLFPLFHYGQSPEQSLFVVPGYLRRVTKTADTMLTPFYSHATTRNGATSLSVLGPLLPLYYRSTDVDVGYSALGLFPFYYGSSSPKGTTFATPLFARFENYNVSRSYWLFPTFTYSSDLHGWETDIHPLLYLGRDKDKSHTVLTPVFWDFASNSGRTTIAFPLYWRFADKQDGTILQVAANTLYREKPATGGKAWEFHLLPLFSYGETPGGSWWNLLFGLAGYDKEGPVTQVKAFWLPITVSGGSAGTQNTAGR